MENKYDEINQAYQNALSRAEQNIGFDAHSMRMTKDSIDKKVVDVEILNMITTGWDYARDVVSSKDSLKIKNLGEYLISMLKEGDFYAHSWHEDKDIIPLKDAKTLKGAHAGKMISKFHNTFKLGLNDKFFSLVDYEIKDKKMYLKLIE